MDNASDSHIVTEQAMSEPMNAQEHVRQDEVIETTQATEAAASGSPGAEGRDAGLNLVAQARRYRKRAQSAEKSLEDLKRDLAEREKTIADHARTIEQLRRREAIDAALLSAQTIDLETARLLLAHELAKSAESEPDVEKAAEQLRRDKPHLFRLHGRARSGGTMSAKPAGADDQSPRMQTLSRAAADAATSGRRTDLLRYLRLRRKT
jgi:hypothetical protein